MSSKVSSLQLNFVIGTAAELIKLYPVIHLAMKRECRVRVISTGQARENFLLQYRDFGLPEEILEYLVPSAGDLRSGWQAMGWLIRALTIRTTTARKKFLGNESSFVIVHGDTLSTMVGALIGRRLGLSVAHVEAGLRSPRLFNPFPEEITRRFVSSLADIHFAPTTEAEKNLQARVAKQWVVNTQGNTLKDAVRLVSDLRSPRLAQRYALCNLHRFENLNSPHRWKFLIQTTLKAAAKLKVIFVLHPQTRERLEKDPKSKAALEQASVELHDRMAFSQFLTLLKGAEFLISDGGSNQEECSYLGKPCLLLREETERPEGLDGPCLLTRLQADKVEEFIGQWDRYSRPVSDEETHSGPSHIILNTLAGLKR